MLKCLSLFRHYNYEQLVHAVHIIIRHHRRKLQVRPAPSVAVSNKLGEYRNLPMFLYNLTPFAYILFKISIQYIFI